MDGTTPRPGGEDEALARLRAADPAAGAEPDDARLAARTSELRAGDGDELAQRRAARRRPWAAVAAVAAGALVLGGAGFGLGRATTPGDTLAEGSAPAIGTPATGTGALEQQARTTESLAAADMAIAPAFGGRTVFSADGLSDASGTAPAWALDAAGGFTAETAARAAAVLGAEGEPVEEQGMWRVGPLDGSAPNLTLSADGSLGVGFSDPALYPHLDMGVSDGSGTADGELETLEEGVARQGAAADPGQDVPDAAPDLPAAPPDEGGGVAPAPAGSPEPVPPVDPAPAGTDGAATSGPVDPAGPVPEPLPVEPEPAEPAPAGPEAGDAVGALRAVLAELGLDDAAAEYETLTPWEGSAVTSVVAHQVLGGMRTGLTWNADVVEGDVLSFHGPLAPVVELGEYDVVSPAQAVARLNDPRFGAMSTGFGIAEMPAVREGWTWGDPPEAPPAAGAALPWRVTEVTIAGAEATLMPHTTDGGATLLVPAYTLTSADGGEWIVIALADHELAF
ncbi:hypothetical protein [Georgenia wangjunii]|uniref:hypothetical protein n=1 Tax=Georgenia wangjunii TaxID=3117730 RepID=UPI002F25F620